MKRAAERQVTRDNIDDGDTEESPEEGFKRADASVLASRPMKGMPKRSLGVAPSNSAFSSTFSNANSSYEPVVFGGFKGFGAAANNNNSFSFTPPPTTPLATPPSAPHHQANVSNDTISKPSPPTPSPMFGHSSHPTSVFGSSSAKTFQSALHSVSSNDGGSNDMDTTQENSNATPEEAAAVKYFTALRGINLWFKRALVQAFDANQLVDFSEQFDLYKERRAVVRKDFDNAIKSAVSAADTKPSAASTVQSSTSKEPALSMPTPPKAFPGLSTSSSNWKPAQQPSSFGSLGFGGFKPQPTPANTSSTSTSNSGFSFATPPPGAASVFTSSPFKLPDSTGSIFGKKADDESAEKPERDSTQSASTIPLTARLSAPAKTPSAFTGGVFGLDNNSSRSLPSIPSASLLPSTSKAAAVSTGMFGNGFGSGRAPSVLTGSIFGKPAGFGLNALPPSSDGNIVDRGSEAPSEGSAATAGTPAPAEGGDDDSVKVLGSNPHDEEGEGEEDEETIQTSKVKVYKLRQIEGKMEWGDMGVGILRLKKHKTTNVRRALLRNSGNGKIVINFKLYSSLSPTQTKNTVSFVGHEDGEKATYRLRLKTEADAVALKTVLDTEIAQIKAAET